VNEPFISPQPSGLSGSIRDAETARLLAECHPDGLMRLLTDHGGSVREQLRKEFETVLDPSEIDDALSQATQRVWRSGPRFDLARGTLRAWFSAIARNCALRVLESKRSRAGLQLVGNLDTLAWPEGDRSDGAAGGARERFARDLHRCIDLLPRLQRAVILADLRAGGVAEAAVLARELATTPNSIYVSRTSAHKALRAALLARGHSLPEATIRGNSNRKKEMS